MLAFCTCPLPTSIGAIPAFTCGEDFGQIQKIYFQRRQASAPFADVTAAGTLANWTAFFAASDATKVVATPFFDSFQIPGSEAITEGGDDNTTLDGTPVVIGATNPRATGSFRSLPGSIFAALQLLNCEPNLTAYFINEFEKIIGYSANGTTVEGFTSTNFFIGDKSILGKNTQDKYAFGFGMRSGWASKVKVVTPVDFLPRTAF